VCPLTLRSSREAAMPMLSPEIFMLLSLKRAQEHFIDRLCSQAKPSTTRLRAPKKDTPLFLRDHHDKVARIAEFFYLMRASAPLTAERVEEVAREHNARVQRKIESTDDPWTNSRLRKGLFSPSAVRMLAMNNAARGASVYLSQSDLARFFCETMSDELTRNLLTVLVDASILISAPAWYNAKLICSAGILEDCYQTYLEQLLVGAQTDTAGLSGLPWEERLGSPSADPVFSIVGPLLGQQRVEPQGQG
jgi:hypothetical protein